LEIWDFFAEHPFLSLIPVLRVAFKEKEANGEHAQIKLELPQRGSKLEQWAVIVKNLI
jgi:hypothetical protein